MDFSPHYKLYSISIVAVLILCIIDLATTNFLVAGGHCYEVNPWIEYLMNKYGVFRGLAVMKFPFIVAILISSLYKKPPRWLALIMLAVAVIYAIVLLWHLFIICATFIP